MREVTYVGAICGRKGNYGILFPDFLGCISGGDTLDEALRQGTEALQFHIDGMDEDGMAIPPPATHSLEDVAADFSDRDDPAPDNWVMVAPIAVMVPDRSDRVSVEIPSLLARDLRDITSDPGRFVVHAARRELDRLKQSA